MSLQRLIRVLPVFILTCGLFIAFATAQQSPRDEFSLRLHDAAEIRDPDFGPRYFAIVRRGLSQFREIERTSGAVRAAAGVDINAIDDTPQATDNDKTDQYITSLNLGIAPKKFRVRVVGAEPAHPSEWKQVVIITGPEGICTGIIIGPDAVVTATHCVCDLKLNVHNDDNKIHITHNFLTTPGTAFQIDAARTLTFARDAPRNFDACVSRGEFKRSLDMGFPDIAIVRTRTQLPEPFMKLAAPQLLDQSLGRDGSIDDKRNESFTIVGFGCTVQPRIENGRETCPPSTVEFKSVGMIRHSWPCAGNGCINTPKEFILRDLRNTPTPIDTCIGDSGGPAIVTIPDGTDHRARLAGITSRPRVGHNCGAGGIYGKIATSEVLCWLRKHDISADAMPEFDTASCPQ